METWMTEENMQTSRQEGPGERAERKDKERHGGRQRDLGYLGALLSTAHT